MSLLPEMTDLERLVRRPAPFYTTAQTSSYDRRTGPETAHDDPLWFANADAGHFVRVAVAASGLRREYILADLTGPGAIVRVWSANPSGTLRFYFDGERKPRLSGAMDYLMTGRIAPLSFPFAYAVSGGGATMYFPLPYQSRCVVTVEYEGGIPDKAGGLYYHVGYRTYAKDTPVRTFEAADLTDAKTLSAMETVRQTLMHPARPNPGSTVSKQAVLKPGQFLVLPVTAAGSGGAAVRTLRVAVPVPVLPKNAAWSDGRQMHHVLRNLLLSLTFDNMETVRVPLGDFFGSGVGLNTNEKAFPVTVRPNGVMECRLVMPFRKTATVKIENRDAPAQKISVAVVSAPFVFDDNTYLFHAAWASEKNPSRPFRDIPLLDAQGEGRFVGVSLAVANPSPAWWGEGDEKIYRDGEAFPSIIGTGTEDYFGYAWSSPALFAAPYHAQTRCDGPGTAGHTSLQRWHIMDDLPFEKSLRFDMEQWAWNPKVSLTFAQTVFWYEKPTAGAKTPVTPLNTALLEPPHITPPPPVAGALEGEALPLVSVSGGNLSVQGGFWELSSGRQRWWQYPKRGDKLVLKFPVKEDGLYQITGSFAHARDYGVQKLSINGKAATPPAIDFFSPDLRWKQQGLGVFALSKGSAMLQVENAGKNPNAAPGQMFGLDYLLLQKIGAFPRVSPAVPIAPKPAP